MQVGLGVAVELFPAFAHPQLIGQGFPDHLISPSILNFEEPNHKLVKLFLRESFFFTRNHLHISYDGLLKHDWLQTKILSSWHVCLCECLCEILEDFLQNESAQMSSSGIHRFFAGFRLRVILVSKACFRDVGETTRSPSWYHTGHEFRFSKILKVWIPLSPTLLSQTSIVPTFNEGSNE